MGSFGLPVIVDAAGEGSGTVLHRVKLSPGSTGTFSEDWLQRTLFRHPECLPLDELLNPDTSTVVPICTELPTDAGPADILYLTPAGKIVLVETKLFRNPEARRQVIAQIIDYAKELTQWTYEDLAKHVAQATKKPASHLFEMMRDRIGDIDEARFIDGVNRSLQMADMLLLVVGDGIRSSLEALVTFFDRYAMLRYSLALVEVGVFQAPNGRLLVQPRILAKTKVVERQIFSGPAYLEAPQDDRTQSGDAVAKTGALTQFWREFLEILKLDDAKQPLPKLPKAANLYFPMPPGPSLAWVSAYLAKSKGEAGVYLTFSKLYERTDEVYEGLLSDRGEIDAILGPNVIWSSPSQGIPIMFKMKIGNLDEPAERRRVQETLAWMSNLFVNAFRDRLERLTRDEEPVE